MSARRSAIPLSAMYPGHAQSDVALPRHAPCRGDRWLGAVALHGDGAGGVTQLPGGGLGTDALRDRGHHRNAESMACDQVAPRVLMAAPSAAIDIIDLLPTAVAGRKD